MKILVLNAGSSSLKFELFEETRRPAAAGRRVKTLKSLYKENFDNHGKAIKNFEVEVRRAIAVLMKKRLITSHRDIDAVGHRVVHGGERYTKSVRITSRVIAEIQKLIPLAPLHNGPNLACIRASKKLFSHAVQVAVFDTAFHQTMPEKAYLYGLPYSFYKKLGIRRFGFHGTSHRYVFEQAQKKLGAHATARTVTCHLGNGCSITAIKNGRVVDTSMGFTPLEGVPMGTRSGDLDPSIIFYLIKKGYSADEVETIINKKSGLLGISEMTSDMRDLWAVYKRGNKKVMRALEFFSYRIAKYIGAYAAALGGLHTSLDSGLFKASSEV